MALDDAGDADVEVAYAALEPVHMLAAVRPLQMRLANRVIREDVGDVALKVLPLRRFKLVWPKFALVDLWEAGAEDTLLEEAALLQGADPANVVVAVAIVDAAAVKHRVKLQVLSLAMIALDDRARRVAIQVLALRAAHHDERFIGLRTLEVDLIIICTGLPGNRVEFGFRFCVTARQLLDAVMGIEVGFARPIRVEE